MDIDNIDMNEALTRKLLIDKALKESKWFVISYKEFSSSSSQKLQSLLVENDCSGFAVEEYPTIKGEKADYVLFVDNKGVGAVESKKVGVGAKNVLEQSKRYSKGYQDKTFTFQNKYHLPFIYSSNGVNIYFQDLRDSLNLSKEVKKFHTPQAINEFLSSTKDEAKKWFIDNPIDNSKLRYYQKEAIESIESAILNGKTEMLVAMATGTGKTFTIVNLIYRLMKSGYGKRILFLVDRRALAAQAVSELSSFEIEPGKKFDKNYEVYSQKIEKDDLDEDYKFDIKNLPQSYLTNPQSRDAFVYVSTVQGMRVRLFGKDPGFVSYSGDSDDEDDIDKLNIPIHTFDVIIADECHRGYTSTEDSKWREVLEHFDCIKIGLTATPAPHTTSFFKQIVYRYTYEQAVNDGFLVDYDAVAISSDITINGVFLKEGEEVKLIDTQTGKQTFDILEDERELPVEQMESWWNVPDRNRKIVKEIKKYLLDQEQKLGRFPKTLVFAENDLPHTSHAQQLVDMLRKEFGRGDDFVQKITGSPSVDKPLQRIREFRNRKEPSIVVTVDMLSTGVDVPKIENIIFLRFVKSRILFEQMLGRGTRLCDEIHKTHFTVFDCFNGTLLEYFRKTTDMTAEPPAKPTRTIKEIISAIANNEDRDYNIKLLSKRLLRISKNITKSSREEFKNILGQDISDFAKNLKDLLDKDWIKTISIIESERFLNLVENYTKPPKNFIVAESREDYVTSKYIFRAKDGSELKPDDYIKIFEDFVKNNKDKITAIEILLNRPKDFHTEQLDELRKRLAMSSDSVIDKFTEHNLRKAYNNNLADIISIIRHAVLNEPLITIEERVDRALNKLKAYRTFSVEERKWLDLIRSHLIKNLLIEKEDFELLLFTREGGSWNKINNDFGGHLEEIINEINEGVLA